MRCLFVLPVFFCVVNLVACLANIKVTMAADKGSTVFNAKGHALNAINERKPMPDLSASLLSRLTFAWAKDLMELGNKKTKILQVEDMWMDESATRMHNISRVFDRFYKDEVAAALGRNKVVVATR